MASVPRSESSGQVPAPAPSNPAALLVWLIEAHEAFVALDAVADDATLPPSRRKLARAEARARYEQAHASLAWRLVVDPAAATVRPTTAPRCARGEPRFESWAE
jgi:hypothetical protein